MEITFQRRSLAHFLALGLVTCSFFCLQARPVAAAPVNFWTYTQEDYPFNHFARTGWALPQDGSSVTPIYNGSPSVFYSQENIHGRRITGRVYPTVRGMSGEHFNEDDIFGFVLGFTPGDASVNLDADYLLLDWKGVTQSFNFNDRADAVPFNNLTPGGSAFEGLTLSRISGIPNSDELWQKWDYPETTGVITQIASATTLGFAKYATGVDGYHDFEILYEADRLRVWVNGALEFDVAGTFPQGRFGIYAHSQETGHFTDFTLEAGGPTNVPGDFNGDSAVDGADFVIWQTNFPSQGGATLDTGDANGDGNVDGADFVIWQTNFPTAAPGVTPVPEPNALILAALSGVALIAARRFRK